MKRQLADRSGLSRVVRGHLPPPRKKVVETKALSHTLVEQTIRAVIEYMREHEMKIGDPLLSEAQFASNLKVSRTVVREAFGALAALKLIDVGAGRRAKVARTDHTVMSLTLSQAVRTEQMTVQQIWDVRRSLELRTGALAATQRTDEEARTIMFHAKAMRLATFETEKRRHHDILFHQTIAKATHNALFAHIICSFDLVTAATMTYLDRFEEADTELSVSLHETIAQKILERDVDGAVSAMNDHFDLSLRKLMYAGFR